MQVGGELPLVRLAEPPAEHVLLIEGLHDADTAMPLLERLSVPPSVLAELQVRGFDSRRNQFDAMTSGGTTTRTPSASCQLMITITTIAPTSTSMFTMNIDNPCETSSCRDSMSAVIRDTRTPVRFRS